MIPLKIAMYIYITQKILNSYSMQELELMTYINTTLNIQELTNVLNVLEIIYGEDII